MSNDTQRKRTTARPFSPVVPVLSLRELRDTLDALESGQDVSVDALADYRRLAAREGEAVQS